MAVGATSTGINPGTGPAYLHVNRLMTAGHTAGEMAALPSLAPPWHAPAAAGLPPGGTGPITPSKSTAGSHTLNRSSVQPARPCQEAPQSTPFTPARRAACCPQPSAHPRPGHNPGCCSAPPTSPGCRGHAAGQRLWRAPQQRDLCRGIGGPLIPPRVFGRQLGFPPSQEGARKSPGEEGQGTGAPAVPPPC